MTADTSKAATPRPWVLGDSSDIDYRYNDCNIWGPKGPRYGLVATTAPHCVPYGEQRENAALIVEAVNAFDRHRALIADLTVALRRNLPICALAIDGCDGSHNCGNCCDTRAALRTAEEIKS